jgi:glucoamylase
MTALESWIDRQYRHSVTGMLRSVSCTVVKTRSGFGQVILPTRGSIVASPEPASYDPEPDYFFHWYRDSAVVVDALRILSEEPGSGLDTTAHLADFVRFSRSLRNLDGRSLPSAWRGRVAEDFTQFLRTDAELITVHGEATDAETRVNPDGTLDVSRWPRPQFDGIALRALTLIRWTRNHRFEAGLTDEITALVRSDLDVVHRRHRESSFDIWEEEQGLHYYTMRVSEAALRAGADWLEHAGSTADAGALRTDADQILRQLDAFWDPEQRYLRSRILDSGAQSAKELDIAVILAAIHTADDDAPHSVHDPRMHATLSRLEALFAGAYAINRKPPARHAPAMGRYAGDVYYSGGAYYFSTLGVAEFYFRAAAGQAADAPTLIARGDAFLETVRAFTPESGELSEQFDQNTGVQRSARNLAWSYAAFISCISARRSVTAAIADPTRK